MNLDELIVIWKNQDQAIHTALKQVTFHHLLNQKSGDVLSKIKYRLRAETGLLVIGWVTVNALFFIIPLSLDLIRISCSLLLNLILLGYIATYARVHARLVNSRRLSIKEHLKEVYQSLNRFRIWNIRLGLPIGIVGVCMFAGTQYLLPCLPWLVIEYGLWWWLVVPKLRRRFEHYLTELSLVLSDFNAAAESK